MTEYRKLQPNSNRVTEFWNKNDQQGTGNDRKAE
jgi:hypothetical protein